ncbi:SGNH hydrolase-type esterase domain-containing protein [Dendryphion nanum]|uniref:SGNH hydrolase-type esterase domain-containing protein n=1 Tax=Dendryphion nanum TaxID=256645 RepID=A0A9P9DNC6_9PLEO|nr:SGNH hydrolase-type esterase domain-containing protein [Dendryphion nanum]
MISHVALLCCFALVSDAKGFPWIRQFASIGDSYAAGLGAGNRIDFSCSRYEQSYPNILHSLGFLGSASERTHQFLACSGATAVETLQKQVPALTNDIDLLTISAGGNDVGMTPVLDACIFQFRLGGDCDAAIIEANKRITDKTLMYTNVKNLFDAVKPKLTKNNALVFVTGYSLFFGVEDHLCDNVTWAVWRDVQGAKPFLKLEMRQKLNDMVRAVNHLLYNAALEAGPNFHFVDYSAAIEKAQGRYCEAGVEEPDPNRKGLSFYEWNTVDTGENGTALQRKTGDNVPKGSFEADLASRVHKTLQEHPDMEFDPEKGFVNKSKISPDGAAEDLIWWLLPDSWKRIFHPRPAAHTIIAQMIYEDINKIDQQRDGITMLISILGGTLFAIIGVIVVLVNCLRRRRAGPWIPAWFRLGKTYVVHEDDRTTPYETLQRQPTNGSSYHTFE